MTLIPSTYMGDTLGIRPDLVTAKVTSWSALLNPAHKGKASIMNIPSIGIMDAAMAIEAMSLYKYPDKGNMTRPEIDMTIKTLIEAKRAGQFRSLWRDFNESINLMASGETVVQSMWANAVTEVKARGIACTYQPLQEGYRAWGSGLGISKAVRGAKLDAAYEFLNWYLSGWVGGYLVRQGFYSAVLETTKAGMPAYDWDYWMEGKPAGQQILNVRGTAIAKKGEVRDGGSYEARMSAVACWNSVMDENTYMVQKWNEFVSA
jgi:putative spermidine/putrescine transport system substrate-binding protein